MAIVLMMKKNTFNFKSSPFDLAHGHILLYDKLQKYFRALQQITIHPVGLNYCGVSSYLR